MGEFFDVLIIGAGLSGIDAAYRMHERNPDVSHAVLEQRERIGGTWDLFRYPGVRSDSDIYTLSYPFRPWTGEKSIADGADIRDYLVDAARDFGIDQRIRFGVHVVSADFDSAADEWSLTARINGDEVVYRCRFLFLCTGYYDYESGYTPTFPGIDSYRGRVVHPQHWPDDLDLAGARIVVIGSGATAITLLPNLSRVADHVTMLQRSPSYITVLPSVDNLAHTLQRRLPSSLANRIIRVKNAGIALGFYLYCRRYPDSARAKLMGLARRILPDDFDVDTHFNPTYDPWDQRLCVIPDADLYRAIKSGKADVVTDTIDAFDETGVRVSSGEHIDADIVVTATGLRVIALGGIELSIDGDAVEPHDRYLYRGRMLEGVPNLAWTIGYTNASWTLRADLTSKAVAKLVHHMRANGFTHAVPDRGGRELAETSPLDLQSGYVQRAAHLLPKASTTRPWMVRANVFLDSIDAKREKVTESMRFGRATQKVDA